MIRNVFNKFSKEAVNDDLPPFTSELLIYKDRYSVAKWALGAATIIFASLLAVQEFRVSKLAGLIGDKDFLIVPGAPEFMRIRPGLIAAESVYLFAEYTASQLTTFSYNTAEAQFKAISEYMTPELRTRYLLSMERPLKMYRDLRVDQIFDSQPVKTFELKNDSRGPKYIVKVKGSTRKYVEGALRETIPVETISFVFRPRKIRAGQPWFFEIESYTRLTPEDEERSRELKSLELEEPNL